MFSAIIEGYALLIKEGRITPEDVPIMYKDSVLERWAETGKKGNDTED